MELGLWTWVNQMFYEGQQVFVTLDTKRVRLKGYIVEVCQTSDPDGEYWIHCKFGSYLVSGRQLQLRRES